MGRRGPKRKANARRRETTRAGRAGIVDPGSRLLRQQRFLLTGSSDLPVEPLGVLFGREQIDLASYNAGRDLAELLATVRGSLNGHALDVKNLWAAILAGGGVLARGPIISVSGHAAWAMRNLAILRARIADPALTEITFRVCDGEWLDPVVALAQRRPISKTNARELLMIRDGLLLVARHYSKNPA